MNDLFYQQNSIYTAKFPNDLSLSLDKQPFITAHFESSLNISSHHCTLKQALVLEMLSFNFLGSKLNFNGLKVVRLKFTRVEGM